jgi:alpha-mannosidase
MQTTISRRQLLRGGLGLLAAAVVSAAEAPHLSLAAPASAPQVAKRIYIAADDHTDYMWSADEAAYRQAFLDMLDYYLDLADATTAYPPQFQSRWTCDGSFWLWTYEHGRSRAAFERLMGRVADGHIAAHMNPLVQALGGTPAEAVLRGLYYAGDLERRFGVRFRLAVEMEDQTLPYGLGALWAGSGARYSWKGICGCVSRVPDAWDRPYDAYWWLGPDGSRLLMKWNSCLVGNQGMGGYAEARDPAGVITYVDTDGAFRARYPYPVIGCFGKGWDDLATLTDGFVTVAPAQSTPSRSVIVSNQQDFFEDFEAVYGGSCRRWRAASATSGSCTLPPWPRCRGESSGRSSACAERRRWRRW